MFSYIPSCLKAATRAFRGLSSRIVAVNKNNNVHTKASMRTHTCGDLSDSDIGKSVTLCGWLYTTRLSSAFLLLKDAYGITQVTLDPELRSGLPPSDSVVKVRGIVQPRPAKDVNNSMKTGKIEVKATELEVLNPASENIPFKMKERTGIHEQLGLKYRYLKLRQSELQRRLRFRSEFLREMRNFLCENLGFVDVETPYLFRRTPGGAHEFIVPTQQKGKFYCLPQSPQQFKQLLMVGGIDRYMQIARCFRDELARPDRQPEFTQLDIEASFIDKEDVYEIVESTLAHVWPEVRAYNEGLGELKTPFPRISYEEAVQCYGSDKPDVRFDMKLQDSNCGTFAYFIVPTEYTRVLSASFYSKVVDSALEKDHKRLSILFYDNLTTFVKNKSACLSHLKPGEVAIIANGTDHSWRKALGTARVLLAKEVHSKGIPIFRDGFFFSWVDNFPLFSKDEEGRLVSEHHPFTAPVASDLNLLYTNPERVRGQHYDLVCNGQEVGGGSIRIHSPHVQKYVLQDILGEDVSQLEHLISALSFGAPPHGGIALGLDRLIAILTNAQSVRDVIAFPKTSEGRDLLSNSPAEVTLQDLERYHINVN